MLFKLKSCVKNVLYSVTILPPYLQKKMHTYIIFHNIAKKNANIVTTARRLTIFREIGEHTLSSDKCPNFGILE